MKKHERLEYALHGYFIFFNNTFQNSNYRKHCLIFIFKCFVYLINLISMTKVAHHINDAVIERKDDNDLR